ncbi:thiol reductant ABC exporter subunit CydC [Boudabousia marimammalium]|uniref:Thiol reductant ABC exporter subunit CydC n=1 Tax=Boudabousia marimammalium TaxID=156892 RepID=A0A1Q5PQH9_9ACTO|nr:thiol reductant ABC exporter subunit CydC [Boudabousia marimammalium]OKL49898.1 thiol reductant ABC exporter subunit CydC [Boudabousia marimammalium]
MSPLLTKDEWSALKQIWPLLKIRWQQLVWSVFLGSLALGSSVGLASVSAWLIARASQMPPILYLNLAVTSVRALGISKALFRYIERLVSHRIALTGVVELRTSFYARLASLRSDAVASMHRGALLSRATADVDAVGDLVVRSIQPMLVTLVVSVFTVFGLSFLHVGAALWLGLCLLFSILAGLRLSARSTRMSQQAQRKHEQELSKLTVDSLENSAEIRVLGQSARYAKSIGAVESGLITARKKAAQAAGLASAVDTLALGLALVGNSILGTMAVSAGELSQVGLAVIVLTPLASFEGTAMLGQAAAQLVRSAAAAEALVELIDAEQDLPEAQLPGPSQTTPSLVAQNLTVAWPQGPEVLNNVNLSVSPGSKIAIVGPSGIGKTTLLLTLAGMLPPREGTALIRGVSAWNLSRQDAASVVSLTLEDAHIFAASVYENLRVARADLDEDEARELLNKVHLENWFSALPIGLNTKLAAGGKTVSGGERRRILVARALASQAEVLLLDEPAEHLDNQVGRALVRDIFALADQGKSIVLVTHHTEALEYADQVLVIDQSPAGHAVITYQGAPADIPATLQADWSRLEQPADPTMTIVQE